MDFVFKERSNWLLLSQKLPVLIKGLYSLHASNISFFYICHLFILSVFVKIFLAGLNFWSYDTQASHINPNRINQRVLVQRTLHPIIIL